jgi:hypothetical protein
MRRGGPAKTEPRAPPLRSLAAIVRSAEFLIGLDAGRRGHNKLFFADHVAEALEMQRVYSVFHGSFQRCLGSGRARISESGSKAEALGHFEVVLILAAQLLCFRPTLTLLFLAHPGVGS